MGLRVRVRVTVTVTVIATVRRTDRRLAFRAYPQRGSLAIGAELGQGLPSEAGGSWP